MGCLVRYSTYSTYSKEPGESGGSAGWRPYSTYSTYSMELGESGAKPRDICAVLRHKMLFLQGVHVCTACKNSSFCAVLRHKNAITTVRTCMYTLE